MKAFELLHPTTVAEATRLLARGGGSARALAGGQDLLAEMKEYLATPSQVVNLKRIPGLDRIAFDPKTGLKIGALATLAEVESHAEVRRHFPALAEAAASVGTPQIRNLGTVGGNLCQRPRCWYYRNEHIVCLKKGGSKCYAAGDGAENKYNAILGGGPSYIVHPSDLATALVAVDAVLTVAGPGQKSRRLPTAQFFTLPTQNIRQENVLQPGELIVDVTVPPSGSRNTYLKFREKDSMDFAVAAVAMAVRLQDKTIADVRVVLGGVAPIPWRATAAEAVLRHQTLSEATLDKAARHATEGAKPLSQNAYKIPLVQELVRRAGRHLAG